MEANSRGGQGPPRAVVPVGVLITRHHILTAGHCLPREVPRFLQYTDHYIAWAGHSDTHYIHDKVTRRHTISDSNFWSGGQMRICSRWYKHPQQDSSRFINDIGIIRCELAFDLVPNVVETVPIAPGFPFQTDTPVEMFGWGVVNSHNDRSLMLKKYTAFIKSRAACANHYVNITSLHHICTHSQGSQSYKGDSGAPALYTIQNSTKRNCKPPGPNKTKETEKCISPSIINLDDLNEEVKHRLVNNETNTFIRTGEFYCHVNENLTSACVVDADPFFLLNGHINNITSSEYKDRKYGHGTESSEFIQQVGQNDSASSPPQAVTKKCGSSYYAVAPTSQYSHYACHDNSACFTSNNKQTCAKTKPICCARNIDHAVRCFRNETLRHRSVTLENEIANNHQHGNSSNDDWDQFLDKNYVCSLVDEENDVSNSDPANKEQKVIIGITSFHLDTYVVLANITNEYYRFINDVLRKT